MQGCLLLREEGDSEKGESRICRQVHLRTGQEEGLGSPRDGAAV